ncbi:hypothetical protein N303_10840, partial [Cuculus canorus]
RDARSLLTPCLQGVWIPRARTAKQQGAHCRRMKMGGLFGLFFFAFFLFLFSYYKDFC